jgi:acyl-CoA reductase-like NAD-dependent aldehyde dehydrogenase
MSTERILVHASVLEGFGQALKAATAQIFASDSILAQPNGVTKSQQLIADALSKGATAIHGPPNTQGKVGPTILQGVSKEMDLYYTESFGPSVSLISVSSDDEAIGIANDTEYGLSGAIFTQDLARGLRMARRIESGAVHINSMSVHDEAGLPHGGVKSSGWGRFNGQWGLEEFLRTKTITYQL